jgi:hypothetical protein
MTTKVGPLRFVSLAMVGITVVSMTHAQAPRESHQAEVMALNQRLIAAYNSKDVSAIMAFYSDDPNAIFFRGHHPPSGQQAALTKANELFKSVSDFHARMESVDVLVSGRPCGRALHYSDHLDRQEWHTFANQPLHWGGPKRGW